MDSKLILLSSCCSWDPGILKDTTTVSCNCNGISSYRVINHNSALTCFYTQSSLAFFHGFGRGSICRHFYANGGNILLTHCDTVQAVAIGQFPAFARSVTSKIQPQNWNLTLPSSKLTQYGKSSSQMDIKRANQL